MHDLHKCINSITDATAKALLLRRMYLSCGVCMVNINKYLE